MANIQSTTNDIQTLCVFNDRSIGDTFCSFRPDDQEGRIKLYNAINNPDGRLADNINKVINLVDVVIKAVKLTADRSVAARSANINWTDDSDEKDRDGFRVILIDTEGRSYSATSAGIYNSVSTLRSVFGGLHFDPAIKIEVNQVKTKNGNTLTLKVVG